jgi:hypothetical protein
MPYRCLANARVSSMVCSLGAWGRAVRNDVGQEEAEARGGVASSVAMWLGKDR